MSELRESIQKLYLAHREFKEAWKIYLTGKSPNKSLTTANAARNKFATARSFLFDIYLNPLAGRFLAEPNDAVLDEVTEFLSIDVPAFGCGYYKEWFLTKLKSVSLNTEQQNKLRQIALDQCRSSHYRRELKEWNRLMIKLADESFVEDLKKLSDSSKEEISRKSKSMLDKILRHRKDLSSAE
jgi:hypothetical protein